MSLLHCDYIITRNRTVVEIVPAAHAGLCHPSPMDAQASTATGSDSDGDGRGETSEQRADRNWNDLLQELRVVQTGVQLLTAFLLTLPFQQRFAQLDQAHVNLFVGVVLLSATATGLLIAPVSLHRHLFQKRRKGDLVRWGHRLALAGLSVLGLAVSGVVLLVLSMVMATGTATALAGGVLTGLLLLWLVLPLYVRHQRATRTVDREA